MSMEKNFEINGKYLGQEDNKLDIAATGTSPNLSTQTNYENGTGDALKLTATIIHSINELYKELMEKSSITPIADLDLEPLVSDLSDLYDFNNLDSGTLVELTEVYNRMVAINDVYELIGYNSKKRYLAIPDQEDFGMRP